MEKEDSDRIKKRKVDGIKEQGGGDSIKKGKVDGIKEQGDGDSIKKRKVDGIKEQGGGDSIEKGIADNIQASTQEPGTRIRSQEKTVSPAVSENDEIDNIEKCKDIIKKLRPCIDKFESIVKQERVEDWKKQLDEFDRQTDKSNLKVTVAITGNSGDGKSTLINALMSHEDVLPTSGFQACTAVVVHIENNDENDFFEADIEFLKQEDWDKEFQCLKEDLGENDLNNTSDDKTTEESARQKLEAVYGPFKKKEDIQLVNDVTGKLGKPPEKIWKKSAADFRKEIEPYIRSTSKKGGQYWPIVKSVSIRLPNCDVWSKGCRIVDLPGFGDSITAREKTAQDYLKNSTVIFIVADIIRAVSSTKVKQLLDENFCRQLQMDNQFDNVAIICTKNDVVNSSELIREFDLEKETEDLKDKISSLEAIETMNDEQKMDLDKFLKEEMLVCAKERAKFVRQKIQEVYHSLKQKFTRLSERKDTEEVKSENPKVFTVSSHDFQKLKKRRKTQVFDSETETEIPAVREHIHSFTDQMKSEVESRIIKNIAVFVKVLDQFLSQNNLEDEDDRTAIKKAVSDVNSSLMQDLSTKRTGIQQQLIIQMSPLFENLKNGEKSAVTQASDTCGSWGVSMMLGTYRATVSRDGKFKSRTSDKVINFNADLARPLLKSVSADWGDFFRSGLWELITRYNYEVLDTLKTYTEKLIKTISLSYDKSQLESIREHIWVTANNQLNEMVKQLKEKVEKNQKEIHRSCELQVKSHLRKSYRSIKGMKGSDVYERMKNKIETSVDEEKSIMFKNITTEITRQLINLRDEVIADIRKVWVATICDCFQFSFQPLWHAIENTETQYELSGDIKKIKMEMEEMFKKNKICLEVIKCDAVNQSASADSVKQTTNWSDYIESCREPGEIVFSQNDSSKFEKKIDDSYSVIDSRLIAKASQSVGKIYGDRSTGTGFRIGTSYLATARHVILQSIESEIPGNIDYSQVQSTKLFVQFEHLRPNDIRYNENLFEFEAIVYENKQLDVIFLKLQEKEHFPFPPCIQISELNKDYRLHLIAHPHEHPLKVDPNIKLYEVNAEDAHKSRKFAIEIKKDCWEEYKGIDDKSTVLFHCAFKHGASGGLMISADTDCEDPQGVAMLLEGFPKFYYQKVRDENDPLIEKTKYNFTEKEKKKFLIVEKGVRLWSIYEEMQKYPEYKDITEDIWNASCTRKETPMETDT